MGELGYRPADVEHLTLREFKLAMHGHVEKEKRRTRELAAMHGITIDDPTERRKLEALTDEQIAEKAAKLLNQ